MTGDTSQADLPRGHKSGLVEAQQVLGGVRGIALTRFTSADVVRHRSSRASSRRTTNSTRSTRRLTGRRHRTPPRPDSPARPARRRAGLFRQCEFVRSAVWCILNAS